VSSLGVNQNTLVTPSGKPRFSAHLPTLLIGHYPENNSEHYVSLEHDQELVRDAIQNSPQIMWIEEQTLDSRAMINNNNHNNNEQNYSNHQVDREIVDVALNNNQEVLPNELFDIIIRIALQQDPLSRFRLQQVNQLFKHVVEKVEPPRLYQDPDLYGNLITFPISVRRMIQVSGSGSGLVTEVNNF